MSKPASPIPNRPDAMWKVWCAITVVTLIVVGGSAVFIQLKFNTTPTSSESASKGLADAQ
jgi:hypothetical protein